MNYYKTAKTFACSMAALVVATTASFASPASATTDVNVRSGPGSSFAVLDTLFRGENVDVVECVSSGWCRVNQSGPSGWVYSRYLAEGSSGGGAPAPVPTGGTRACFFTGQNHTGESFCVGEGQVDRLPPRFDDNISSYQLSPGASVRFCLFPNMAGQCYNGNRTTPTLGAVLDNRASSIRVFAGRSGGSGGVSSGGSSGGASGSSSGGGSSGPNCSFALVVGPDGPKWTFTCGPDPVVPGSGGAGAPPPPPPPPPPPAPRADEVCFYTGPNYSGDEYCDGSNSIDRLQNPFKAAISSVRIYGNAWAKLWRRDSRRGYMVEIHGSTPNLPNSINDRAYSAQILTGTPIFADSSGGTLQVHPSFAADLDSGLSDRDPGVAAQADFWYNAVSADVSYMVAQNGAQFSLGSGSRRGFAGCAAATYSDDRIRLQDRLVNKNICILTSQGRYAEMKITGFRGNILEFSYRLWEDRE